MSTTQASFGQGARGRAFARQPELVADVVEDWQGARPRWARLVAHGTALAFQQLPWLDAWYQHCACAGTPVVAFLVGSGGRDAIGLPLVRVREGVTRVITFADGGLTDYNAPALAAGTTADGQAIWRSLRRALPAADLLRFEKMPVTVLDRPNPLAQLPGATSADLIGNILHVPGSWDEWHWGLERTFRKELERSSRVFEKNPAAVFRRFEAGPDAERVYDELKRLQAARIRDLGLPYILDREPARGFYDAVVRAGLRDGTAVLTALTIGEDVVAALLGITDGRHFAMTRLATPADPRWKAFSPGRLVIERTMKLLHAEGYRAFDFTIGDYTYKRRIGVTPVPMVEFVHALSPLGLPMALKVQAKAALKRHPALIERWRSLRRQASGAAADVARPRGS